MIMDWTKEIPASPTVAPSDWYWFWHQDEKEPIVMEVWPNRKHYPPGWWGSKVKAPLSKPSEKRNVKPEKENSETDTGKTRKSRKRK